VVIHNAGIRTVDAFYSNPNVTAIVYAHLPGQDSGRALVNLMFADDNKSFSGRMPYTVAKTPSDYGSLLSPSQPGAPGTLDYFFPQSNFTEGVEIDYRAFIAKNIEPRFAFGYGLTYSTFSYSGLATQTMRNMSLTYLPPDRTNGTITQGGLPSLWQNIATVSFSVTNTGGVTAKEVPQVYIGIPNAVKMQLRGFDKINLRANQTQKVSVKLTRRDLSSWSVVDQQWVLQKGTYNVYVGKSVLDVQLTGSIVI
jgi:beta-glucosidase